jgi:transposase
MSGINLTPLLSDCQAKVVDQYVVLDKKVINVVLMPDERYTPICSRCHTFCKKIHSYTDRDIRDLNVFDFKTNIQTVCKPNYFSIPFGIAC